MKTFHTYILTNKPGGTLYIGVTSNLVRRVQEHKEKILPGFTKRYEVSMLVYYEEHRNGNDAISREKQLKRWRREWKIELIESINPLWRDLAEDLILM